MMGPISRGDNMGGLVRYLLGPGRAEEHTNQRVIAAEASMDIRRGVLSAEEVQSLAFEMDLPRRVHGTRITRNVKTSDGGKVRQPAHVWHVALSNHPGDPILSDAQWAAIAEDLMDRMGFASGPGRAACPWVAVHHGPSAEGNDHIHIAVSLVREDGTKANVHNDRPNVGRACSRYERAYGLTVVEGRQGGAKHDLTPPEVRAEKQRRVERPTEAPARPTKAALESTVRGAAVASASEAEFVGRLRADGLALRPRFAQGGRSAVVGYSIGVRGTDIVWHGGGTLASDLTLPKLRALWGSDGESRRAALAEWKREAPASTGPETDRYAAGEWQQAATHVSQVVERLAAIPATDDATWRTMASEAAGVVGNLAARLEAEGPGPLTRAADELATAAHRPSRVPGGRGEAGPEFRGVAAVAAQALLPGGPAAWLALIAEMRRVAQAIEAAHAASGEAGAARALLAQAAGDLDAAHTRYGAITTAKAPGRSHGHPGQHLQLPGPIGPAMAPGIER